MSENQAENKERSVWFLDTETTGFLHDNGDRVIEIGAIEYINREPTGRTYHVYLDPERDVPEEAYEVHGLSRDDLIKLSKGKKFKDIAHDLIETIKGSEVIAHNATFDINFLNAELNACGAAPIEAHDIIVTDSLQVANMKHPGQANNLDALLRRHVGTDNYKREFHGALLDASLLAQVYLLMTVQQNKLEFDIVKKGGSARIIKTEPLPAYDLKVASLSDDDLKRHGGLMERVKKTSKKELVEFGL